MKYIEIPESPQVRPGSTGIQMNPEAAAAPWRSVQQAGKAIGDVGEFFALYAQKRQEADDAAGLTQFENVIGETKRAIQADIAAEGDESKWPDIVESHFKEVKFEGKNVSERGRAKAQSILQKELENERSSVFTQFLKRDAQRKSATYDAAVEYAVEDGDMERVEAKVKEAASLGIYSPETVQKKLSDAQEKIDYYDVISMIETDPKEAEELLSDQTDGGRFRNFKNLSPNSRATLLGRARQQEIDEQKDFLTDIVKQAERGEFVEQEQLQDWMDEGRLSPWHAKQYRETYLGKTPQKLDAGAYASRLRAINEYDPATDPSKEEFSKLMGSIIGIPSEQAGFLRRQLESKLTPGSVENSDILRRGRSSIESMFDNGFLGDTSKVPGLDTLKDPEGFQKATEKKIRLHDELNKFMQRKPEATNQEVHEFLNGLVQTDRDTQAVNILTGARSPANKPTSKDLDELLREAGYSAD